MGSAESVTPSGPRIADVGDNPPDVVIAQWCIGLICLLITIAIWSSHKSQLNGAPRSELRRYYLTVIGYPLVINVFSVVCLFSIRPAYLWELIIKIYESVTVLSFASIIMGLMGYESDVVARTMKEKGTETMWRSTYPFLCFTKFFLSPSYMSAWWVNVTYTFVIQFVYVIPFMGLIQLWMSIDDWHDSQAPSIIGIVSTLIAMQGLFMLYKATYPVIHHYQPTFKFVTIKLIVFISIIQARVIEAIVEKTHASIGDYDDHALKNMWTVFILAVECPVFSLLMLKAFPVTELVKHHGEQSPKMEMLDMASPTPEARGPTSPGEEAV